MGAVWGPVVASIGVEIWRMKKSKIIIHLGFRRPPKNEGVDLLEPLPDLSSNKREGVFSLDLPVALVNIHC